MSVKENPDRKKNISEDSDAAQSLNSLFSSIITNLKIPEYTDSNFNYENITDLIIKVILKFRNHPSILTIGEVCKERCTSSFSFSEVCKGAMLNIF